MQIFGDLAVPNELHSRRLGVFFEVNKTMFKSKKKIVNLEGLLDDQFSVYSKQNVVFNHSSVLPVLSSNNIEVACLANNHTLDLPYNLYTTKTELNKYGIVSIGASKNAEINLDESNWANWIEDGKEVYLYNACWNFLLYTQKNPAASGAKVNLINETKVLNAIKSLKEAKPEAIIITYFHWSFDLEVLPFPSYRKFAHDLVTVGVNLIVGCHSHCIQPIEQYKGATIIYGLGNFYFPNDVYLDGKLRFPEWSQHTLVVDYKIKEKKIILHRLKGKGSGDKFKLVYEDSLNLDERNDILNLTGKSDQEYLKYYIKNRRKRLLVPVFKDYKKSIINHMKYSFLIKRAIVARRLAEKGLRAWQN